MAQVFSPVALRLQTVFRTILSSHLPITLALDPAGAFVKHLSVHCSKKPWMRLPLQRRPTSLEQVLWISSPVPSTVYVQVQQAEAFRQRSKAASAALWVKARPGTEASTVPARMPPIHLSASRRGHHAKLGAFPQIVLTCGGALKEPLSILTSGRSRATEHSSPPRSRAARLHGSRRPIASRPPAGCPRC